MTPEATSDCSGATRGSVPDQPALRAVAWTPGGASTTGEGGRRRRELPSSFLVSPWRRRAHNVPRGCSHDGGGPPQAQETDGSGGSQQHLPKGSGAPAPAANADSHEHAGDTAWGRVPGRACGPGSGLCLLQGGQGSRCLCCWRHAGLCPHGSGVSIPKGFALSKGLSTPGGFLQTCPARCSRPVAVGVLVSGGAACVLASGHAASQHLSNSRVRHWARLCTQRT